MRSNRWLKKAAQFGIDRGSKSKRVSLECNVGAEADIFRHTFSSNQLMRQLRMKMGNYRKTPEAISSLSPEQYPGNPGYPPEAPGTGESG